MAEDVQTLYRQSQTLNFSFRDKVVVILTPQPWSSMYISKHHYALELAYQGSLVYYVNPVLDGFDLSMQIEAHPEISNLFIVQYHSIAPYWTKFKARWLFNPVLHWQVRRLRRRIGRSIDVVWDFDCGNVYQDFKPFGAKLNIYHPVDQAMTPLPETKQPDVIFSVSHDILFFYKEANAPKHFINHGLGGAFLDLAQKNKERLDAGWIYQPSKPVKASYVGNLMIPFIDKDSILRVIERLPEVRFHFYGPYSLDASRHGRAQVNFIRSLQQATNVCLHGMVPQRELPALVNDSDLFFVKYQKGASYNGDNSHKILEYLSTGKMVVSNGLNVYLNNSLFIKEDVSDIWIARFTEVIGRLGDVNSVNYQISRIELTLSCTYGYCIEKIKNHCLGLVSS